MNQILITGEEKKKKEKKVLDVKTIVTYYAICIILLGIFFIGNSAYATAKINEAIRLSAKPTVETFRNDDNNTVEVTIKHIRGIKTVEYGWNDEEAQTVDGKNQKEIKETIDLIGGTNTLTISVTEENGQTVTYNKTFVAGNIPTIELEAVSNGVKIKTLGESNIDYIKYSWDEGEEEIIKVGKTEHEETINAPKGKHILNVEVVAENKNVARKTQTVIGDAAPTVAVKARLNNDGTVFVIEAEDDEEITKVEIELNDEEMQTIEVNERTFNKEIPIEERGWNYIIVTVYNNNNLTTTKRIRHEIK